MGEKLNKQWNTFCLQNLSLPLSVKVQLDKSSLNFEISRYLLTSMATSRKIRPKTQTLKLKSHCLSNDRNETNILDALFN